jgi:hypothetical protein
MAFVAHGPALCCNRLMAHTTEVGHGCTAINTIKNAMSRPIVTPKTKSNTSITPGLVHTKDKFVMGAPAGILMCHLRAHQASMIPLALQSWGYECNSLPVYSGMWNILLLLSCFFPAICGNPRAGPEPDTRIKEGVNIPCTWGNLQRR